MANFIKKNWQKDTSDNLIKAGARFGGAFGAAWALRKWFGIQYEKNQDGTPKLGTDGKPIEKRTLYNIGGPMFLAVGVLGDLMLEDERLRAICQGVTTFAGLHSLAVISPADNDGGGLANKIGVAGLGDSESDAALMSGVAALGETSETSTELPPEFAEYAEGEEQVQDTDGKTYNNDWGYLAENIDQADQITRSVNGLGDAQENADLMGTEETARLMGLF